MTDSPVQTQSEPNRPAVALSPRQLAWLTQGFAFLFWGVFLLVGVAIESLISSRPRLFILVLGVLGAVATALAGWRLRQAGLGHRSWRRATALLILSGGLVAYLSVFACLWLRVPGSGYLLAHALGWMLLFLVHLMAANYCVYVLGQMLGSRSLMLQGGLYGAAVLLLLLVPYLVLVVGLLQQLGEGVNPLGQLQFWLTRLKGASYLLFVWLTPLSLSLSLVWTAQDLVWGQLTKRPADNTLDPAR